MKERGKTKKNTMQNTLKIISANFLKPGRVTKSSNIKILDKTKNWLVIQKKLVNIFNDHFSSIGSKIEQKIPFHPGNFKDYLNKKDKMESYL